MLAVKLQIYNSYGATTGLCHKIWGVDRLATDDERM
ncbi:hypothetical protein CAL7102_04264 [Dulcicalothrix desertica PCC 7102]|nr:hypothetical protein CAL7102_04264 [Dulcicalothrix desertica PCC 7102]